MLQCSADQVIYDNSYGESEAEVATICHENKQGHRMKDMTKLSYTTHRLFCGSESDMFDPVISQS